MQFTLFSLLIFIFFPLHVHIYFFPSSHPPTHPTVIVFCLIYTPAWNTTELNCCRSYANCHFNAHWLPYVSWCSYCQVIFISIPILYFFFFLVLVYLTLILLVGGGGILYHATQKNNNDDDKMTKFQVKDTFFVNFLSQRICNYLGWLQVYSEDWNISGRIKGIQSCNQCK